MRLIIFPEVVLSAIKSGHWFIYLCSNLYSYVVRVVSFSLNDLTEHLI